MDNLILKPIGQVLEQAGLISDFQIRAALEVQSQGYDVRLGKILVSQALLKPKTVDFFAEQLPKLLQQPTTKPLGYYFQAADLIDAQQINYLLEEQKRTGMLLGELAVERGLLNIKTLNFFLQHLGQTENKLQLLPPSHQAIIKSLHLETKAASPYYLFREICEWTGGHPLLMRQLCQIIADYNYFIPTGMEATLVTNLVQEHIIHNWETQVIGEYLKTIQSHLLNNTICLPRKLLRLYLQIVQQGVISTNSSREKEELINLGLIIEQKNQLKVANRLYQSIFNPDWVKKQLFTLEQKSLNKSHQARKILPKNQQSATATPIKNEPLTQIAALIGLFGLLLIFPLVMFFNNSASQLTPENNSLNSQSLSKANLCVEPIPTDETIQEAWRIHLEQQQQRLPEQFSANCQRNLDKLIVLKALQLGKENRVLDGIHDLCEVSSTSESFNQAQFWLSRWYNSADWGEPTKSYLSSLNDCPAAEKFSDQFYLE